VPSLFKNNTQPGWLAIVAADGRADFVHVRRDAGALPKVVLAESIERGADYAAFLSSLRKPLGLATRCCSAVLRHGEYQLIQTEAVDGTPDEARDILRWKLKDQVEFAVDAAAVDFLPIPAGGRSRQVFAAIAAENVVAPLVQAFQAARVPLAVIDLPESSQRNLATLFEEPGRALAALVFDDAEGLLTFTLDGELLVVRHVEIPARQIIAADAGRRTALFERIALDVQRSLDNFDRMYSTVQLSRLVVAALPGVDGFVDHLRDNLTVPVATMDLGSVLDLGAVPALLDPLRQFQCLRGLGAALRDEA
jgi:MSHA biogenesis protein MshI